VIALRGVGFEIEPGEAVAILGANGAGKSTLLRLLAGLSRPSAGELVALREAAEGAAASAGETAERDAPGTALSREALRREVGYVGHATLLYGELTARENLVFAARLHGGAPERSALDALLDEFGLLEVADRRAGTFSRGMAQRLSIARAIVHDPRVLLLDEPFTGLDQTSADRLSARLAGLRAGGRTLILVTHDPARAVEIGDRALVLHRGAIRARPGRGGPGDDAFEPAALQALLARLAHGVETGVAA
jgi:heme exporter protein A